MSLLKQTDPDPYQELKAHVAVGDMFKTWVGTDIGRYIIGRAEQDELKTLRQLSETDPTLSTEVMRLQERSKMFTSLLNWIEQVINEGEIAKYQIEQLNAHERDY